MPAELLATARALCSEVAAHVERLLAFRTFPDTRRVFAESQIKRLRDLAAGERVPPEYYARGPIKEREILTRQVAGEPVGWVGGFNPSNQALAADPLLFLQHAIAFEAQVLETHIGWRTRAPKKKETIALVRRMRATALGLADLPATYEADVQ